MKNTLEEFAYFLKMENKVKATISKYKHDVQELLLFMGEGRLSREAVHAYREQLIGRYKPQTVNGKLSAINAYLKFVGQEAWRQRLLNVQRRAFIRESRELKHAEYMKLLVTARNCKDKRLFMMLETICATGMRISELSAITVESIHTGRAEIAMKGKVREVLLPRKLCNALIQYAKQCGIKTGLLFVTRGGKAVNRSNIWRSMKKLSVKAEVNPGKVFPHNLRHLFAQMYYAVEKDIVHLADILGHSSVKTTRIYVATSGQAHERTLERMKLLI